MMVHRSDSETAGPASSHWRPLDGLAVAFLVILTLVFYRQLALTGRVLVSFDALAYFGPNLAYLGASLREGRLPLWDPLIFGGVPFLANSQTGVFYPPNWLAVVLPAPRAYAWSVVLHAGLAAVGAYAFGRRALRLGALAALATAVAYAFGGFFSAQVGHLNQQQAAAWLPILLLVTDALLRRPSGRLVVAGALVLCLDLLAGHIQVAYLSVWAVVLYAGGFAFAELWSGFRAARASADARLALSADDRSEPGSERVTAGGSARGTFATGRLLGEWLGWLATRAIPLALLGALGVGLAAAQLLPTLELTRLSIRSGGLDFSDAVSFSLPPWKVLLALLPTFGVKPTFSEWLGYSGVAGLLLAGVALVGRPDRRAWTLVLLCVVGLALALGQFDPLYARAYRWIPGLSLFRVPARWLMLFAFGLAGLAGLGLQTIIDGLPGRRRRVFGGLAVLAAIVSVPIALYAVSRSPYPIELPGGVTLLAWAGVAVTGLVLVAGGLSDRRQAGSDVRLAAARGRWLTPVALLVLLSGELLAASGQLDLNHANLLEAATGDVPEMRFLRERPGIYRVFGVSDNSFEVADVAAIRARLVGVLDSAGIYDYLVTIKDSMTLMPNLPLANGLATIDGYDGGVLPLRRYVEWKSVFPNEGKSLADGRLRLQFRDAPDPRMLGWVNVRYLVLDRIRDLTIGGVYYDTAFERDVGAGGQITLTTAGDFSAASIGIVSHLEGADAPAGQEVAVLVVESADGRVWRLPIRAGRETDNTGKPVELSAVGPGLGDESVSEFAGRIALTGTAVADELPEPLIRPTRVTIEYTLGRGRLVVRALSLAAAEPAGPAGGWRVVSISEGYEPRFAGDAKIYENKLVLPRAFVVGRARVVADDAAVLAALRASDFAPSQEAIVDASEWARGGGGTLGSGGASAADGAAATSALTTPGVGLSGETALSSTIEDYRPERLTVRVSLAAPGLLVVTDSWYPGWRARVDGREVALLQVDYLFRGVRVEAGEHQVELTYEPLSFRLGLAISALALIGAGLVGWRFWRRDAATLERRDNSTPGRRTDP